MPREGAQPPCRVLPAAVIRLSKIIWRSIRFEERLTALQLLTVTARTYWFGERYPCGHRYSLVHCNATKGIRLCSPWKSLSGLSRRTRSLSCLREGNRWVKLSQLWSLQNLLMFFCRSPWCLGKKENWRARPICGTGSWRYAGWGKSQVIVGWRLPKETEIESVLSPKRKKYGI